MTYPIGEALILTRLRAMSQFDAGNSSRGKWGILNSGKAAQYAILKPGPHAREMQGYHMRLNRYSTIIQLWQRYKDDGTSMTDLESLVDVVVAYLDKYRLLGSTAGTIEDAQITEVREFIQTPATEPHWIYVELVLAWQEEAVISYAE